jgi:hypothetical protein
MIRPLLLAGLALSIFGSATAAHAHGDSRDDRYSSARDRCESHSRHDEYRDGGRSGRYGRRSAGCHVGGGRYGSSRSHAYGDRGRWNDERDDYRDRDRRSERADSRDFDRDDDRDWRDRAADEPDDRLELDTAPVRPRSEIAPRENRTPTSPRRAPATGSARRPAY